MGWDKEAKVVSSEGHISASQVNVPALAAANYQNEYENYVGNERQEHKGLSV